MKNSTDTEVDFDQLQDFAIKNPVFTAKWFSLMARLDALRHRVIAAKHGNSRASENAKSVTVKVHDGQSPITQDVVNQIVADIGAENITDPKGQ